MNFEVIIAFITFAFIVISVLGVSWLKDKGLWTVALFGVNIIEQICDFLELQGYGKKKYEFVKGILLKISPKLTDEQIKAIIEKLVTEMNELKKG